MAKHILSLEVPQISNAGVFVIEDTSIYTSTIPVTCGNLQILAPGFIYPSTIEGFSTNFRLVLNACSLGIMATGCSDSCPVLPDGMYHLRYSVSPNDKVYVEYWHLRTTVAINRLDKFLCSIGLEPNLPTAELEYLMRSCDIIRNFFRTAKLTVENEHDFEQGVNLYRYGISLLDKISNKKRPFC